MIRLLHRRAAPVQFAADGVEKGPPAQVKEVDGAAGAADGDDVATTQGRLHLAVRRHDDFQLVA